MMACANWYLSSLSKFFNKPDGSRPAATQQTKLSFAPKSAVGNPKKKQEAVEKEEEDGDVQVKVEPPSQGSPSSTSAKENLSPEQGKRAPVMLAVDQNC